jgi:hypothetical protein
MLRPYADDPITNAVYDLNNQPIVYHGELENMGTKEEDTKS